MAYRRIQQGLQSERPAKGKHPPFSVYLKPVQRSPPSLGLYRVPSLGQPQLRPLVSAIAYEVEILSARHQLRRQLERFQINLVPRLLIVEAEPIASAADLYQPAFMTNPARRRRL